MMIANKEKKTKSANFFLIIYLAIKQKKKANQFIHIDNLMEKTKKRRIKTEPKQNKTN